VARLQNGDRVHGQACLADDRIEVNRNRHRPADRGARPEGDMDRAEDLLVLEDVSREPGLIVRPDAQLREVRSEQPVGAEPRAVLGPEAPAAATSLPPSSVNTAGSSDGPSGARLAATIRPCPRRGAMKRLSARQVAERARGGEVLVVGEAAAVTKRDGRAGGAWTRWSGRPRLMSTARPRPLIAGPSCRSRPPSPGRASRP